MYELSAVKVAAKQIISYVPSPGWAKRYPSVNRLGEIKMAVLCRTLLRHSGNMVFAGPFASMRLADNLQLASDPRFIVGCYEEEVHPIINSVICSAPRNIIDIGSAFGYYAVGLALKIADTSITAFEAVEERHWAELAVLARINGVDSKIRQYGICTVEALASVCSPNSFILCDCEGAEMDLLQPVAIAALRSCKILVELHEFFAMNLVSTLISRFRETHQITLVEEIARDPIRYRILKHVPRSWRSIAVEEAKWIPHHPVRVVTSLRFMVLTPRV